MQNIFNRTSVRNYTGQEVSKELLEQLVRAGMAAPSARNRQPWKFVVVNERPLLDALAADLPYAKMLQEAPAAIVVCGDRAKLPNDSGLEEYWVQDCSAASENILLAAVELGLGTVWTGVFPRPERMQIVTQILNLGANLIPLNVIVVGYPAGVTPPKDKWTPENLLWNRQ